MTVALPTRRLPVPRVYTVYKNDSGLDITVPLEEQKHAYVTRTHFVPTLEV